MRTQLIKLSKSITVKEMDLMFFRKHIVIGLLSRPTLKQL